MFIGKQEIQMTYFCTTHKNEDLNALVGEKLDACTSHMVFHTGYDITSLREFIAKQGNQVIWEMEKDATAKFGYRFGRLYGIPA